MISPRKKRSDYDDTKDQTKLDLCLYFGEEGAQEMLTNLKMRVYSHITTDIKAERERILQDERIKTMDYQDLVVFFKFKVEQGREKEAVQYFEKGLDQDENNHNISELQKIFSRPKSAGKIELVESKGEIIVVYNIYKEYLEDVKEYYQRTKDSKFSIDFQADFMMKGSSVQNKKSFTSIKADYIDLHIRSNKMKASQVIDWSMKVDIIGQDDHQELNSLQIFSLLPNLEEMKLKVRLNSLRRMMQYHNYAVNMQQEDVQQQIQKEIKKKRSSPLANKGIFKDKAEATILYSDRLIIDATLNYKSEEVFLRFISALIKLVEDLQS